MIRCGPESRLTDTNTATGKTRSSFIKKTFIRCCCCCCCCCSCYCLLMPMLLFLLMRLLWVLMLLNADVKLGRESYNSIFEIQRSNNQCSLTTTFLELIPHNWSHCQPKNSATLANIRFCLTAPCLWGVRLCDWIRAGQGRLWLGLGCYEKPMLFESSF